MYTHLFALLLPLMKCDASNYYYRPFNVTRTTLSGIASYRSSLTLDWLVAEDSRRELAAAFETEEHPVRVISGDCIGYPRPSREKIGRYMLELLKHLEGDNGKVIQELYQSLIRSRLLVESSAFEEEPNLESLVKTPTLMMGEPYATFPRIVSMVWMSVTDPSSVRKHGWCSITKVNQFLMTSKPYEVARHMRALDMVVDRARFIMEDFIQHIIPLNLYQSRKPHKKTSHQELNKQITMKEYNKVTSSTLRDRFHGLITTRKVDTSTALKVESLKKSNNCSQLLSPATLIIMCIYLL